MPSSSGQPSFQEVLTQAINDLAEHGFDSMERVQYWTRQIEEAARRTMVSPHQLDEMLRGSLSAIYRRMVEQKGLLKTMKDVGLFTLEKVRPALRAQLDRSIVASANLIVLNRQKMVQATVQRFQGWATSVPAGGSDAVDRGEEKANLKQALGRLPFEERRVMVDQGHKLSSSLSEIVATGGGAIAARWRSNFRQAGYDYREDHAERDSRVYLVKGSWAQERGYVKPGPAGYTDDITKPGEEVYCRCYYTYLFNLRDLPADMVTRKGADELARVRAQIKGAA